MSPRPITENTLFYGDNLIILREHILSEIVDLIYLDPPFNSSRSSPLLKGEPMNISQRLAWELVALNDRGDATEKERLALEICYGAALVLNDPESFSRGMNWIAEKVSDPEMRRLLRLYTALGLK